MHQIPIPPQPLPPGANTTVPTGVMDVTLAWTPGPGTPALDPCALLLGTDGRVRSDADFVFYNQPSGAGGAVRCIGAAGDEGEGAGVRIALGDLPSDVERVLVAASIDGGRFGDVGDLVTYVASADEQKPPGAGAFAARCPSPGGGTETLLVVVEFYRRQGGWKLRSVGQGYASGLAGLATDYGVDVAGESAESEAAHTAAGAAVPIAGVPAPAPAPAPVAAVADTAGDTSALPADLARRVDLRKEQVAVCLEKKGLRGVRAHVVLVLDASGSMYDVYGNGTVARMLERLAPVAARLDDDGAMDVWLYADHHQRLRDPLRVPELKRWIRQFRKRPESVGVGNDEPVVMRELMSAYHRCADGLPTLVLFVTDGDVWADEEMARILTSAAEHPVFWQFLGLGSSEYGILERLDTLPGRVVDNCNFFALDDIDSVTDDDLYDRLLGEFPVWLVAARAARLLG
ncbi:VWA domain-containing protein [Embleya sp. MST-111070]|uniref:VWA domain-containing protein n=1 Tax=Embleya sp. MST-111070 TaxID=3398231 RepID=UPI003F7371C9